MHINGELAQLGNNYEADEFVINVHSTVDGSTDTVYTFNYRKQKSDSNFTRIHTVIVIVCLFSVLLLLLNFYMCWKKSKLIHDVEKTPQDLSEEPSSADARIEEFNAPPIMFAPNP